MLHRENEENIDFTCSRECFTFFFALFRKKMAKYLFEISEWYFDVVNKDHRFYILFDVTVSDERQKK